MCTNGVASRESKQLLVVFKELQARIDTEMVRIEDAEVIKLHNASAQRCCSNGRQRGAFHA